MNEGEKQLKIYLGLPESYRASFASLFKVASRFEKLTGNDQGITTFSLVCWLDEFGDFTSKTDVYSKMVNQIFMGMGKDIPSMFPFIELCQNGYKED